MLLSDPNLLFLQQGMKMEDRCIFLESQKPFKSHGTKMKAYILKTIYDEFGISTKNPVKKKGELTVRNSSVVELN